MYPIIDVNMRGLWDHLFYANRQLRRSPIFAIAVIFTLALGIGANGGIFTLFDQVLLRKLPVHEPEKLVRFAWAGAFNGTTTSFGGEQGDYFSYPMFRGLQDDTQAFEGILATDEANAGISWQNHADDHDVELVSGNYFDVLGLQPVAGRLFTAEDDMAKNASPVVVLSFGFWKERFGHSPNVVGQIISVNGHPFKIIGILPENFHSVIAGFRPDVFIPLSMSEEAMPWTATRDNLHNSRSLWLTLVGRLRSGMTLPQAEASVQSLWQALRSQELAFYPSASASFRREFVNESYVRLHDNSMGFSPGRMTLMLPLLILMSMAALLLTMCAVNVATLLLLRASARTREVAIRYALGAKSSEILTSLAVENALLGVGGAVVGLIIGRFGASLLTRLMSSSTSGTESYSSGLNAHVIVFTAAITLLLSLLFSIAPAIRLLNPDMPNTLRQNAETASKSSQGFRRIAVGVQIALSLILLGGAGLFVRTLQNLQRQYLGFQVSQLATFYLDPTVSGYGEAQLPSILMRVLDDLRQLPGVKSVAATTDPELGGSSSTADFTVQGHPLTEGENMSFEEPWVTPGFFSTLRQPLLAGREFTASDLRGQSKVAIVNLSFSTRFYGSAGNALGRLLGEGVGNGVKPNITIVGVVGDVKHKDIRSSIGPAIYRPYFQEPHPEGVQIYVRTIQPPVAVEGEIRKSIQLFDPTLIVDSLKTMQDQVETSSSDIHTLALLAVTFSALAISLVAIGLYGVLAYSAEQRTREIGVRLALGASRQHITMLILREMMTILAVAVCAGLPTTVLLAQLFRSQLYGVSAFDPSSLLSATLLVAFVAAVASIIPVYRALRIKPMRALRTE